MFHISVRKSNKHSIQVVDADSTEVLESYLYCLLYISLKSASVRSGSVLSGKEHIRTNHDHSFVIDDGSGSLVDSTEELTCIRKSV